MKRCFNFQRFLKSPYYLHVLVPRVVQIQIYKPIIVTQLFGTQVFKVQTPFLNVIEPRIVWQFSAVLGTLRL